MVHDTKKSWTMTPQPTRKRLGVGASCTVKLRFLHPKNQVKDKIPNQSSSQQLTEGGENHPQGQQGLHRVST